MAYPRKTLPVLHVILILVTAGCGNGQPPEPSVDAVAPTSMLSATTTVPGTGPVPQTEVSVTELVLEPQAPSPAASVAPTGTPDPLPTLTPGERSTATEEPVLPDAPLLAQELAEQLTGHNWQHVTRHEEGFADDIATWAFFPDGTFRWQFTSDYILSYEGAWSVSPVARDRGILFLAGTTNGGEHLSRSDVLSLQFRDGGILLGETAYAPAIPSSEDGPPEARKQDHEVVAAPEQTPHFSLWQTMSRNQWTSETVRPGEPSLYSFLQDGTYLAQFDSGACQYSGTWSLMSSGEDTGEIRLSIPANPCDPQGPADAQVKEMPVALKNGTLMLRRTAYIPVAE